MGNKGNHSFMLQPGEWLGEGTVSFSASPDEVKFYTKWTVKESSDPTVSCEQVVEILGVDEHVLNRFTLSDIDASSFQILLENDSLETVSGKGIIDDTKIAWEFRGHETFEGFEVYERSEDGGYTMHAEYASPDQFRTVINGRIWKKAP